MNSMTGFGRGEASRGGVSAIVEMKSVNNRFRDVQLRVDRAYSAVEPRIHTFLKDIVVRGRVEVHVRRASVDGGDSFGADVRQAERVYRAMVAVAERLGRDAREVPLAAVLAQPGVLASVEQEPDAQAEWSLVETALTVAASELTQMRAREGEALRDDLRSHKDELLRLHAAVSVHADGLVERTFKKLQDRMDRLVADRIEPKRLAAEAALLADKADVSEELARLKSHGEQLAEALEQAEPVGRKLDFLLQEIHREINTVGSKASDHPVSALVVEMKSVLERLREQAANVE